MDLNVNILSNPAILYREPRIPTSAFISPSSEVIKEDANEALEVICERYAVGGEEDKEEEEEEEEQVVFKKILY